MPFIRSLAVALALLVGCAGSAAAQEKLPVRIGWLKASLSTISQAVAQKEGLYARNGLDATVFPVASGNNAVGVESLMRGDFDVYYGPMTEMARLDGVAMEQGAEPPVVAVALSTPGATYLTVAKDLDFRSVEDLRGKTLGVSSPGSVHLVMFRHYLASLGQTTESLGINTVRLGGSDMVPALTAHQIDGFLHSQPNPAIAEVNGVGKIALAPRDMGDAGRSPTSALMVRRDWLAQNGETVRRVIKAFLEASDLFSSLPPDQLAAIAGEAIGADETVVQRTLPNLNPRILTDFDGGVDLYWQTEMAAMKQRGEIAENFQKQDMFDGSFMPAATR